MKRIYACLFASCLLASACSGTNSASTGHAVAMPSSTASASSSNAAYTPSQNVARAGLAAPTASSPDVPAALLSHLEKGRSYAEFRRQTLANGWAPVPTAMCMANVVGDNYKSLCDRSSDLQSCHLCEQMPELNTCSGDGYCTMQFRHAGTPKIMQVTTYGDTDGWNGPHGDGLMVTDWDFSNAPDK